MLVLAHPDDETVGAASLLPALTTATFVYVTDGAPRDDRDARRAGCATREAYAERRQGETLSALESVGVARHRVEFVDCVDQEAAIQLPMLIRWLEILIREQRPSIVLTHPYEGGHPDHDACAFVVHTIAERLAAAGEPRPIVAEFTSYHANGAGGWTFGEFLSARGEDVIERKLSAAERNLKRRLIGCYRSQRSVLQHVPLDLERFRVAPEYDFSAPPHRGRLLYETFGWEISGARWREHAARALHDLEAAPVVNRLQPMLAGL